MSKKTSTLTTLVMVSLILVLCFGGISMTSENQQPGKGKVPGEEKDRWDIYEWQDDAGNSYVTVKSTNPVDPKEIYPHAPGLEFIPVDKEGPCKSEKGFQIKTYQLVKKIKKTSKIVENNSPAVIYMVGETHLGNSPKEVAKIMADLTKKHEIDAIFLEKPDHLSYNCENLLKQNKNVSLKEELGRRDDYMVAKAKEIIETNGYRQVILLCGAYHINNLKSGFNTMGYNTNFYHNFNSNSRISNLQSQTIDLKTLNLISNLPHYVLNPENPQTEDLHHHSKKSSTSVGPSPRHYPVDAPNIRQLKKINQANKDTSLTFTVENRTSRYDIYRDDFEPVYEGNDFSQLLQALMEESSKQPKLQAIYLDMKDFNEDTLKKFASSLQMQIAKEGIKVLISTFPRKNNSPKSRDTFLKPYQIELASKNRPNPEQITWGERSGWYRTTFNFILKIGNVIKQVSITIITRTREMAFEFYEKLVSKFSSNVFNGSLASLVNQVYREVIESSEDKEEKREIIKEFRDQAGNILIVFIRPIPGMTHQLSLEKAA